VDYKNKRLDWVKLQEEDGRIGEAIFLEYSVSCGWDHFKIMDINKNGRKEIIKFSFRLGESKRELPHGKRLNPL